MAWQHGKHMSHMASQPFPAISQWKIRNYGVQNVPTFMTFTKFLKEVLKWHGIIWDVFDLVLLLCSFVSFDAYLLDVLLFFQKRQPWECCESLKLLALVLSVLALLPAVDLPNKLRKSNGKAPLLQDVAQPFFWLAFFKVGLVGVDCCSRFVALESGTLYKYVQRYAHYLQTGYLHNEMIILYIIHIKTSCIYQLYGCLFFANTDFWLPQR